jgi:hypothetical protein
MKNIGSAFLLLTLASISLQASARASEVLPRPVFTADREFVVEAPESATDVTDASMPVKVAVFDRAAQKCGLSLDDVRGTFSQILDSESSLWVTLNSLFPHSLSKVRARGVTVVIDDFSDYAGTDPVFASFYLHTSAPQSLPMIGLDCSALSQSYWLPSLAHELTHAMLDGENVQSGFEEGLAQRMESDAGGEEPTLSLKHLQASQVLPTVLESRRPVPSRESYAITYLFANYIHDTWGGYPTLRAMIGSDGVKMPASCAPQPDFLSQATCRAQARLGQIALSTSLILTLDHLTRDGLLRYFYVALAMNNSQYPEYSLPEWKGFTHLPDTAQAASLVPGQAMIFKNWPKAFSPGTALNGPNFPGAGTESYRLNWKDDGEFRITSPDQSPPNFTPTSEVFLVMDLGY